MTRVVINFHGLGPEPAHIDAGEAHVWCADPGLYADLLDETREAAAESGIEYLITFDDGNRSDLELGLKPLADRGMTAIFFPCAGRLDDARYLNKTALRELVAAGMTIGSHGWAHTDWRKQASYAQEIGEAKDRIEQAAGAPVTSAAIPFGSYDRRVLGAARVFDTVFTSDAALADRDGWLQPRFSYDKGWSRGAVRQAIARARSPVRQVRQKLAMTVKRFR